jgi:hypothetical protein
METIVHNLPEPVMAKEVIANFSQLYKEMYEKITGKK